MVITISYGITSCNIIKNFALGNPNIIDLHKVSFLRPLINYLFVHSEQGCDCS